MGPLSTALALVSLRRADALSDEELREGTRWLRARQRSDGSFPCRPYAELGHACTTAACGAALSLSKDPVDREAAARAREFVDAHGGVAHVLEASMGGDVAGVILRIAGELEPGQLPTIPLSIVLVPRLVEQLSRRATFYGLTVMIATSLIERGRVAEGSRPMMKALVARAENARAVELLTLYQNRNGSLMNVVFHTALLVPALLAAGIPPTDSRLASAIAWLRARGQRCEGGLFFDVYGSDVWSTASYLRVLMLAGVTPSDPAIIRAVEWLLEQQCARPHPKLTNPNEGAPRVGGWGFQSGEDGYPDCDTTSTVLDALGRALLGGTGALPPRLAARVVASIAAARSWLLAMQNPDGGWASFFWGHPTKPPGPIMTRPMQPRFASISRTDPMGWVRAFAEISEHVSDSSTEDVTSRVLAGLARTGSTMDDVHVQRGLDFLHRQQCSFGAFWGRWKVNYLPVTAFAVAAFAALGDDMSRDDIRRAIDWSVARQNPDGGFGESVESYRDPSMAGRGTTTAATTGSVLLGLLECPERARDAIDRAVDYLVATQRPDGAWENGDAVATLMPPDLFYVYEGAAKYIPLEALARYALTHPRA